MTVTAEREVQLWDRLMRLQTDLALPAELTVFFNDEAWLQAASVLDVGTGNGYYLRRLAQYFPRKHYRGIDSDPRQIAIAATDAQSATTHIEFTTEDVASLGGRYDVVIARLLVQHLSCLDEFMDRMRDIVKPAGGLIVIDSEDHVRKFTPPLPLVAELFRDLRAKRLDQGCDRDAAGLLTRRAHVFGFSLDTDTTLVVPSTWPGGKARFVDTYSVVFDLVHEVFGVPCDTGALVKALTAWASDPVAYTQLGVRVVSYRRST